MHPDMFLYIYIYIYMIWLYIWRIMKACWIHINKWRCLESRKDVWIQAHRTACSYNHASKLFREATVPVGKGCSRQIPMHLQHLARQSKKLQGLGLIWRELDSKKRTPNHTVQEARIQHISHNKTCLWDIHVYRSHHKSNGCTSRCMCHICSLQAKNRDS